MCTCHKVRFQTENVQNVQCVSFSSSVDWSSCDEDETADEDGEKGQR